MLELVDRHIPQAAFLPQQENGQFNAFVESNMKKIPLTKNKFALVDDEDYDFLMQWKWYFNGKYAVRNIGGRKNKSTVFMHHLLCETPKLKQTDHVNMIKLDNRRKNLRAVSAKDNKGNEGLRANNTSGYKGVVWCKNRKKWVARLGTKPQKYLGGFSSKIEAARSYNVAAAKYFKECARLNNVD